MKNKKFIITNQAQLQKIFKDDSLRMKKKSKITFLNSLSLDSNILFEGNNSFGKNNTVGPNCTLRNIKLGDNNLIRMSSLIESSKINDQNIIGPFAFIRENTDIKNKCIVGAYVEVTRSLIKKNSYISHRAFIGDATIGSNTLIGAGVNFCNYNFKTNSRVKLKVGSNCKIGANATIIGPINIKPHTIIPASTKFNKFTVTNRKKTLS
jgi:bifunctional UDP-N-acetylglucosamine pyrophosphorylase/glucosamine-1-phosphate N-acetyltransferase